MTSVRVWGEFGSEGCGNEGGADLPSGQKHRYVSTPSTHTAPFWHGIDSQSF